MPLALICCVEWELSKRPHKAIAAHCLLLTTKASDVTWSAGQKIWKAVQGPPVLDFSAFPRRLRAMILSVPGRAVLVLREAYLRYWRTEPRSVNSPLRRILVSGGSPQISSFMFLGEACKLERYTTAGNSTVSFLFSNSGLSGRDQRLKHRIVRHRAAMAQFRILLRPATICPAFAPNSREPSFSQAFRSLPPKCCFPVSELVM